LRFFWLLEGTDGKSSARVLWSDCHETVRYCLTGWQRGAFKELAFVGWTATFRWERGVFYEASKSLPETSKRPAGNAMSSHASLPIIWRNWHSSVWCRQSALWGAQGTN